MRVRRLAAAGTAALLLPFAACSDGNSNAEPVEPTSSTTPSPSETASEGPTLPPEAQGTDEAAATAFVEFYFELISDAMVTGDTAPLRTYSDRKCTSCRDLAAKIDDAYESGGSFRTKGWLPEKFLRGQSLRTGHEFYLRVRRHPRSLMDGERVVDRMPGGTITMQVVVLPGADGWELAWLSQR